MPQVTPAELRADQYQADVLTDFGTMPTALVFYLQTLQKWRSDQADVRQVVSVAQSMLANIVQAQHALAARAQFDPAPRALTDYRLSVDTYAQSATLTTVAAAMPRGPLRSQLQLAASRVQILADRIFDQGHDELKPFLAPEPELPSAHIHKPAEVPNWAAGAYAPGPPLTAVGGVATEREYQETRPEQSFHAWSTLVRESGLPTAEEEATALTSGPLATLRSEAKDFTRTADLLYARPDPVGERLVNTRLQLALLLHAEATQLAQAAALAPHAHHGELLELARALAGIGDRLWDQRLGTRYATSAQAQRPE
jgi:hypothetical protein